MSQDEDCDMKLALQALGEVMGYYQATLSDFAAEAWASCMEQYGAANVRRFLLHHMRTNKWAPRFCDLDAYMGQFSGADHAFELVAQQVRSVGPHRSPHFDGRPEITFAVQEMGGWAHLCATLPAPEADRFGYESVQKRFAVHYQAARSMLDRGVLPQVELQGLHALGRADAAQRLGHTPAPGAVVRSRGG